MTRPTVRLAYVRIDVEDSVVVRQVPGPELERRAASVGAVFDGWLAGAAREGPGRVRVLHESRPEIEYAGRNVDDSVPVRNARPRRTGEATHKENTVDSIVLRNVQGLAEALSTQEPYLPVVAKSIGAIAYGGHDCKPRFCCKLI